MSRCGQTHIYFNSKNIGGTFEDESNNNNEQEEQEQDAAVAVDEDSYPDETYEDRLDEFRLDENDMDEAHEDMNNSVVEEERLDANGRTYYVNHIPRTTLTPTNNEEERLDANGRTYYVNHIPRTTLTPTNNEHEDNQNRPRKTVQVEIGAEDSLILQNYPSPISACSSSSNSSYSGPGLSETHLEALTSLSKDRKLRQTALRSIPGDGFY